MYERFFNYSNELLCIADLEGNFVEVNDAFSRVLGYTKAQLLAEKFLNFIHPDDLEATQAMIDKLAQGENIDHFANRYIDSQGNNHIFSWTAHLDKKINKIFAIARDITKEYTFTHKYKQLQTSIAENVIFVQTDNKGLITEVNDKFCKISGYSREELLGKTHKIVNSGLHDKAFFKNMWQTISSKNVWSNVITNRRKDGSLYYVDSIITPICDINNKIESYISIRFDITDRIESQQESAKMLTILNETGNIAKVGGWELEVESGKLSWTDETFKILGVEKSLSPTPVLPEGLQLFTDEYKPIIDEAVTRAIEYGEPYALELEAQTPQGDVKWVYTDGKAKYKNGKVVSLSGTIQDIHDKKITELKYNLERQKSIQNSKFAALGELAASIAHEINNPLGIISGYTELLMYQGDDKSKDKLAAILKSCERISYIVKNLKRFSRTDMEPQKELLDLAILTKEALALLNPRLTRSLVEFSFDYVENVSILGHSIEIEQVIINLINNAIDAIDGQDKSWIKLSITENETQALLTLEDSGPGIPETVQKKMFDPFFTTKDIHKGTGLGLSVVRGILDEHKATLELDNNKKHTCFCISFPKWKQGTPNG